jgi:RND family efflux transporter MFP subunit
MGINIGNFSKRVRHLLQGLVLLAWVLGAGASAAAEPITVPVVVVGSRAAGSGFELEGTVQAVRQATLAAQIGGNVLSLAVRAGDRVKAGQLIARIDPRDAQAALQRSDAAVAQAEGVLRGAQLAVERTRELRRQGFVSQAALDIADTDLSTAQAGAEQARAARSQAALARGYATLVAPFDAIVLATHVEAGDLALPGRAVATVYAPGALRVVVQVPSSRAAPARAARQVSIRLPDGTAVKPARQAWLPSTDPVSQTVEIRLDLEPSTAVPLTPGQSMPVLFDGAAPAATASATPWVPSAAVLRRGELTAVYVADGERFALRSVRVGPASAGGQVPIWAGLKAGERVAADAVRAGLAGATPAR